MILPKILILVILSQSVYGWVEIIPLVRHASHLGDCYIPKGGDARFPAHLAPIIIGGGNTYTLPAGNCFEARCQSGGLAVEYAGCGVVAVPHHCEAVENKDLKYPACCPTIGKCGKPQISNMRNEPLK